MIGEIEMPPVEHELKVIVASDFVLPDLSVIVPGGVAIPLAEERLTATYFDTSDLNLTRWGISLRHRVEAGTGRWTLKLPSEPAGPKSSSSVVRRHEIEIDGPKRRIPPELLDLVAAYVRGRRCAAVATLDTRRLRTRLVGAAGELVAEVDDDRVDVLAGGSVVRHFREIEVELSEGGDASILAAAKRAFVADGASGGGGLSKVARALGDRATAPPEVMDPKVGRHPTAAAVVRSAIAAGTLRLLQHDPGVRLGDDPEHVHQARVACRRLRSDLRTFAPLVDSEWRAHATVDLKWVGDLLGRVRDADVLLDRLRRDEGELSDADTRGYIGLLGRLEADRTTARQEALAAMATPRYLDLLETLVVAAAEPPLTPEADAPASDIVPRLVRRPWRQLARSVQRLPSDPADEDLHAIRVRSKRTRYAAEASTRAVGKPARRLAAAAAELQGVLGDLNDAVLAEQWLRGATRGSPAQAVVAGQLIALRRAEANRARKKWPKAWRALDRPSLRSWL